MRIGITTLIASVLGLIFGAITNDSASATTVNELNIYNGGPAPGAAVNLNINMTGNTVSFAFTNNSTGAASHASVHEIYFETGLSSLLSKPYTFNAPGTSVGVNLTDAKPLAPANPASGLNPRWSGNLFNVSYD